MWDTATVYSNSTFCNLNTIRQIDFREIFEIIKQLKKQESTFKGSSSIKSEWDRITAFVRMNMSLNLEDD